MDNTTQKDYLNFKSFLSNADIKKTAENLMKANEKLLKNKDSYGNKLIATIDAMVVVLESLDTLVKNNTDDDSSGEVEMKSILEKIIEIHQRLLSYRKSKNILGGPFIDVLDELTMFYPLFLISELLEIKN